MSTDHDPTKTHDYNWVMERRKCFVDRAFIDLKNAVEAITKELNNDPPPRRFLDGVIMFMNTDPNGFSVIAQGRSSHSAPSHITFHLRQTSIAVDGLSEKEFVITPFMNKKFQCRYRINGQGEYLRWQVLRRALHSLFYGYTFEEDE